MMLVGRPRGQPAAIWGGMRLARNTSVAVFGPDSGEAWPSTTRSTAHCMDRTKAMSTVAITQDRDAIGGAIAEGLGHMPLERLVRGRFVAVKPNDTWVSKEDTTAVTQPDTLRAVLEEVVRCEPRQLVVTGGAGAAETEDVFRLSGMLDVVREFDVELIDHNRPPFTEVKLEYAPDRDVAGPQKSVMVNRRVLEYETLIVVSQLKMHATATVTLALKNIAMSYPAADYYGHPRGNGRLHRNAFFDDMHSFIAAMSRRFPIDLAITVGHPAMVATGPIGGYVAETGLAIVSTDALAADVVGARLLGFDPQAVRHLWEADRLELGETDTDHMTFPAMTLTEAIEAFTEAVYGERLSFEHS
jgi:uncharacterized protein (DUF362 family)